MVREFSEFLGFIFFLQEDILACIAPTLKIIWIRAVFDEPKGNALFFTRCPHTDAATDFPWQSQFTNNGSSVIAMVGVDPNVFELSDTPKGRKPGAKRAVFALTRR
jgi:hypothetical protein